MNQSLISVTLSVLILHMVSSPCPGQSGTSYGELLAEVERLDIQLSSLSERVERHEQLRDEARQILKDVATSNETIQLLNRQLNARRTVARELQKWAEADLVLGNDRTPNAAALAKSSSGYEVVAFAAHPFQQYAIAAAVQGIAPFRAEAASGSVLAELSREIRNGATLPMRVADTINSRLESLAEFSPRPRSGTQFMLFQDPVSGKQKVAAVQPASADNPVQTLDRGMQALAQTAFTGGSVWIGDKEEIEPHLEIGTPFIDYCALGMIHTLRQEEFRRDHVTLSINMKLDTSLTGRSPEAQH